MEHMGAGADWSDAGIRVKCACGWKSEPVQMGYKWIETLTAYLNAHIQEMTNE
jgi:hypothetical protein